MENGNNKDGFFREAFKDFERKPSDRVWNNIEKGIKPSFIPKTSFFKSSKFIVSSAIVVTLSAILFYLFQQNNNQDIKVITSVPEISNQIIENKNIAELTENNVNEKNNPKQEVNDIHINKSKSESNNIQNNQYSSEKISILANLPMVDENKQINQTEKVTDRKVANNNLPKTVPIIDNNNQNQTIQTANKIAVNGTKVSEISFSPDQNICKGDKIKLSVNGGATYLWSTGERTQSVYVSPFTSTDYSVVAIDEYGNRKTGLISVNVSNCEVLYVPNAFTPNGDGQHDVFKAVGNGINKFEIVIVSRSGQVVFSSKNIDDGWDGSINGNPAPMGTYIYSIKYIDELNKPHTINGHVNVIR